MTNPSNHQRRSIRLQGFDYTQHGAYFLTICAQDRMCLFGDVVDDVVRLNDFGRIVKACWYEIPQHFQHVMLDTFVIMPNHVHGILVIAASTAIEQHVNKDVEARRDANHSVGAKQCLAPANPTLNHPTGVSKGSLGAVVGSFKSAVTKRINILRNTPGALIWQRNYYERVIRNDDELNRVRQYITDNPLKWALDRENPLKHHGQG